MEEKKLAELKKRSTEVMVGGKKLYIRFDLNALAELEERYGSLDEAFTFDPEHTKGIIAKIKSVLYEGLKAIHNFKEEEVGAMFSMKEMPEVQAAMEAAAGEAMPEGTEEKLAEGKGIDSKNLKAPKK